MIILNTPSKTQNFITEWQPVVTSTPLFQSDAAVLVSYLKKLSRSELAKVLQVSETLAESNFQRYQDWQKNPPENKTRPAILAYVGQIYQKMNPSVYTKVQQLYAQDSVRILSGLYGMLRAYDLMQPYRLEMYTRLATDTAKNLYEFWREKVTRQVKKDLQKSNSPLVIDLASKEYSEVVDFGQIEAPFYRVEFRQKKGSVSKIITLYAKQARGMMLEHLILARAQSVDDVLRFTTDGYTIIDQKDHLLVFEKVIS